MDAIIVPCTQQKVWSADPNAPPTPARDAYTAAAFKTWRAFAESSGVPWFVLSTKYGLVTPDQPISNYHVPISEAESDPDFLDTLRAQFREYGLGEFQSLVVLDWERFQEILKKVAAGSSAKVQLRKILY
jgi:hypothetical protein